MLKRCLAVLSVLVITVFAARADVDILVIGSLATYNSSEKAFSAQFVADELRSILQGDASVGAVNVVFDNIYTTMTMDTAVGGSGEIWSRTYYRHSLAQYYFWPDGRTDRMATLKSAASTTWDYVVLMDDAYLMARMPGAHAAGVKLMADAAISGGAKVLLMMQWPGATTSSSVAHYGEVAYRVGDYDGITVIPAGYAWDSLPPKDRDSSSQHPTPNGAYLAAAAIYAEMYDQSAGTGSTYNTGDASIADHALAEVRARKLTSQYSDNFNFISPFAIRGIKKRYYTGWDRGSSTEDGIKGAYRGSNFLPYTGTGNGWTSPSSSESSPAYPSAFYDFNIGRANSIFESWKRYIVDTTYFSCAFGITMQDHRNTGPVTMLYGIDKRTDDGTDLGIGHKMISTGQINDHGRTLPVRLLWATMFEDNPTWSAYSDSWHMHGRLNVAIASYLYTIQTGRCAVGTTGGADYLYARRLGYETAWRMSTLQLRAPGFEVLPSSWSATNVAPTSAQMLSVRFVSAPTSDVTVAVSSDDRFAGKASPSVLVFTPSNYKDAQTVTVLGETGEAGSYPFNVVLTTSSADPAYEGVSDSWDFYNTRPDGPMPPDIQILGNGFRIDSGDMTPDSATGTVASSDGTIPVYSFALTGFMPSAPVVEDDGFTSESITSATVNGTLSTGLLANAWLCWGDNV